MYYSATRIPGCLTFLLVALSLFMARNLSRKVRREIKARKVLEHQQALVGKLPVREFTLTELASGDKVFPETVYMAPEQPIADGWPRDSQTAIVMKSLELHGAEFARL